MLKPSSIFESLAQLFIYLLEDYLLGKYLVICSAVDWTQTHFLNSLIKKLRTPGFGIIADPGVLWVKVVCYNLKQETFPAKSAI